MGVDEAGVSVRYYHKYGEHRFVHFTIILTIGGEDHRTHCNLWHAILPEVDEMQALKVLRPSIFH